MATQYEQDDPRALLVSTLMNSEVADWIRQYAAPYRELMSYYRCAMMEVTTKFNVLDEELSLQYDRNPIESIKTRLKSVESILGKMSRKNLPLTVESIEENLCDVAGVRVICAFPSDIYRLADAFLRQDDVRLIKTKDYIKEPKPNGYRSLHIVVDVPVYMSHGKLFTPVEIQIRTVAMDFWATLEHGIRYKATEEVPQKIVDELRECADVITATDYKMQEIFKVLQEVHDADDSYQEEIIPEFIQR